MTQATIEKPAKIRKARKSTEIQSAVIYRVTDKATGEVCYQVKSDSSDIYYTVRFDNERLAWRCDCPAHKPCKHEKAVIEVVRARHQRERELAEAATIASSVLAEMVAHDDVEVHVQDSIESGELDIDPWADPNYNPFAGMTEDEKRAARYWMFENNEAA